MKLKTKIDQTDKADLDIIVVFADFMFQLLSDKFSKAAFDLSYDATQILNEEFCGECEQHCDGCECPKDYHREYERDWDDWDLER